MIRLNDINKTVIDEKSINEYYSQGEMNLNCIRMIIGGAYENFMYSTKELRDKDIELLDQLFDVKSIEDKANEEKPSYDFGELQVINPNPTKKEKYLTWDEVCNKKGEYFSAEISNVLVTLLYNGHEITIFNGNAIASFVYSKDLFNALKLKKVE
jgi:hypothetical protein